MQNKHLEHPEDSVISGDLNVLNWFTANGNISAKIDGAPAIVWGTNPANGKFFVGTKSAFAQNAKVFCNSGLCRISHGSPLQIGYTRCTSSSCPGSQSAGGELMLASLKARCVDTRDLEPADPRSSDESLKEGSPSPTGESGDGDACSVCVELQRCACGD